MWPTNCICNYTDVVQRAATWQCTQTVVETVKYVQLIMITHMPKQTMLSLNEFSCASWNTAVQYARVCACQAYWTKLFDLLKRSQEYVYDLPKKFCAQTA